MTCRCCQCDVAAGHVADGPWQQAVAVMSWQKPSHKVCHRNKAILKLLLANTQL